MRRNRTFVFLYFSIRSAVAACSLSSERYFPSITRVCQGYHPRALSTHQRPDLLDAYLCVPHTFVTLRYAPAHARNRIRDSPVRRIGCCFDDIEKIRVFEYKHSRLSYQGRDTLEISFNIFDVTRDIGAKDE